MRREAVILRARGLCVLAIVAAATITNATMQAIAAEQPALIDPADAAGLKAAIAKRGMPALEKERVIAEAGTTPHSIQFSTDLDCGYLPTVTELSPTHFAVTMDPFNARMFLFRVTGVAGKTVRIDFQNINPHTWPTENPVFTESPTLPGLSDVRVVDSNQDAQLSQAYNGPRVPQATGGVWHFVQNVWREQTKILSIVQTFTANDAIIAMKVPYTVSMNDAYCHSLADAGNPSCEVETVGKSAEGRPLHVVRVTDVAEKDLPNAATVVIYAREHTDEHDSSWVARGTIDYLRSPAGASVRKKYVFIVIPLLDPDTATREGHEGIILSFLSTRTTPESIAYARYFQKWVDAGNRLDFVFNLHNVESREGAHLFCPITESERQDVFDSMNEELASLVQAEGLRYRNPKKIDDTIEPQRLGGWLRVNFGATHMALEADSEEGGRHLTVAELCGLGKNIVVGSTTYLESGEGKSYLQDMDEFRRIRSDRWRKYRNEVSAGNAIKQEAQVLWLANGEESANASSRQ